MAAITDLFSRSGTPAKTKIILLGYSVFHSENLMAGARSLNIEHVSLARISRAEISRRSGQSGTYEDANVALMRRWFFTRKPDAGFILTEFPATLLQALVFDEWLDARDETLDGVLLLDSGSPESVVRHYRTLGLLLEADVHAA